MTVVITGNQGTLNAPGRSVIRRLDNAVQTVPSSSPFSAANESQLALDPLSFFSPSQADGVRGFVDSVTDIRGTLRSDVRDFLERSYAEQELRLEARSTELNSLAETLPVVINDVYQGRARLHQWRTDKPTIVLVHGIQTDESDHHRIGEEFQAALGTQANVLSFWWGTGSVLNGLLEHAQDLLDDGLDDDRRLNLEGAVELNGVLGLLAEAYEDFQIEPRANINILAHSQGTVLTSLALGFQHPNTSHRNHEVALNEVVFIGANIIETAHESGQLLYHLFDAEILQGDGITPGGFFITNLFSGNDDNVNDGPGHGNGAGRAGFGGRSVNSVLGERVVNFDAENEDVLNAELTGAPRRDIKHCDTFICGVNTSDEIGWWSWLLERQAADGVLIRGISDRSISEHGFRTLIRGAGADLESPITPPGGSTGGTTIGSFPPRFDSVEIANATGLVAFLASHDHAAILAEVAMETPTRVPRGDYVLVQVTGATDPDGQIRRADFYRDSNGNRIAEDNEFIGSDKNPGGGWTNAFFTTDWPLGSINILAVVVDDDGRESDRDGSSGSGNEHVVGTFEIVDPGAPPPALPPSYDSSISPDFNIVPHRNGDIEYSQDLFALAVGRADTWQITPQTSGGFQFETTGPTDTLLGLYEFASGELLAFDEDNGDGQNSALTHSLNAGTTYSVVIGTQRGSAGAYGLRVTGTNQTITSTISVPAPVYSASASESIGSPFEIDYFKVRAPTVATRLDVVLDVAATLDGWVRLEDQNHQTVATAFLAGQGTDDHLQQVPVNGGEDYFVTVIGLEGTTGLYTLDVDFNPDDPGLPDTGPTSPTGVVPLIPGPNGALLLAGLSIGNPNEIDTYIISPKQTGEYLFETLGSLDTQIAVYHANGTLIAENDDFEAGKNAHITATLNGGDDYFVLVRAEGLTTGDYDLQVNGPPESHGTITVSGLAFTSNTSFASIANNARSVHYSVVAPAGTDSLTLTTERGSTSTDLDVSIRVLDSNGSEIASKDDVGVGGNETLPNIPVVAGEEYFITLYGEDQTTGSVKLHVDFDPDFQVTAGTEFPVNSDVFGDQDFPHVGRNGSGTSVIVWAYSDQNRVSAQRIDANGQPVGGEFRINVVDTTGGTHPRVAVAPDGSFVVVWTTQPDFPASSRKDLFMRRFDSSGNALTGEIQVDSSSSSSSQHDIAMGPNGEFIVSWADLDDPTDPNGAIFIQRFNVNGTTNGSRIHVNTTTDDFQGEPDVAILPDGSFYVVWQGRIGNSHEILGQAFDSSGNPVGSEVLINQTVDGHQAEPAISATLDGSKAVAWRSDEHIFARVITVANEFAAGEFQVSDLPASTTGSAAYLTLDVAAVLQDKFLVTWVGIDSAGQGISARQVGPGSRPLGPEFSLNQTETGSQYLPAVASDGNEQILATWVSVGQDFPNSEGIFAVQHTIETIREAELEVSDTSESASDRFVDFGILLEGSSTQTHTVTVSNEGNTDLVVTNVELFGPDASAFTLSSTADFTLAPAAQRDLTISFNPTTAGDYFTAIRFSHNDTADTLGTDFDANPHWISVVSAVFTTIPPTVEFTAASQSGSENAGTLTITAQLSEASNEVVTVPFTISGTATQGASKDFTITASPITIPAGSTSADLTITVTDDSLNEADETVIVIMNTPSNALLGSDIVHTATISDNDAAPSVEFTTASQSIDEDAGSLTITAQLSVVSGQDVTIPFTIGGSATGGALDDFTITASPITISAGSTSADITVTINDDSLVESAETIVVILDTPTNAMKGAADVHTATINDNDLPSGGFDLQWAFPLGVTWDASPNALATDSAGNIYITGNFQGTLDFDPGAGSASRTSSGRDIYVAKYDSNRNFQWVYTVGGSSSDIGHAIDIDPNGNVFVTGEFRRTVDFDPGSGTHNLTASSVDGRQGTFIVKLNSNGGFVWARHIAGTGFFDVGTAIGATAADVYIGGYFEATADFDPGSGVFNLTTPNGNANGFLLKLTQSGNFVWVREVDGTGDNRLAGLDVDSQGRIYTVGKFGLTAEFTSSGSSIFVANSGGGEDAFIARHSASGNLDWVKSFGHANSYDVASAIIMNSQDRVVATGTFSRNIDFDPGTGVHELTSTQFSTGDVFVLVLGSDGNFVWAENFGSTANDVANSIAVDDQDFVYVTGNFSGTANFATGDASTQIMAQGRDAFLISLDASGNPESSKVFGGSGSDDGRSVAIHGTNEVYVAGIFSGTADFDPSSGVFELTTTGAVDHFILRLAKIEPALPDTLTDADFHAYFFNASGGDVVDDTLSFDAFIDNGMDVDSFLFASDHSGTFTIDVGDFGSAGLNPIAAVYDASTGVRLAIDDDSGPDDSALLTVTLERWHRYIVAVADANRAGTGDVSIVITSPAASPSSATSLDVNGDTSISGVLNANEDTDFFKITSPENMLGNLSLNLTPESGLDAVLVLWDENGNQIAREDSQLSGGAETINISNVLAQTSFRVSVYAFKYESKGGFTLDVDFAVGINVAQTGGSTVVSETGTSDTFDVVLDRVPLSNVVLTVTSSDTSEATVDKATLTFTPANWDTAQTVTVSGEDDVTVDGDQITTITVSIDDANSDDAFDSLADQTVSVTTTDDDRPAVTDEGINGVGNSNRSGVVKLVLQFDQATTVSSGTALRVYNHTTNSTINLSAATLEGNGTTAVTWDLSSVSLPDGRYTAELSAADAAGAGGLPLAVTHTFEFLVLEGDLNGDGAVNFADYGVVGSNFDPLPGAAYRAGDANGDGAVNFADYGVIGVNFNPLGLAPLTYDLGDAPEANTNYPTTLVKDGAVHVIGSGLTLGTSVDPEGDGQPHADALGDDNAGDDEDGVTFGSLTAGSTAKITVVAAVPSSAVLNGWVDFNADGDWSDLGEQIFTNVTLATGSNPLSFSIPATAAGDTFARFRITTSADHSFTGLAPDGEVEDYKITIAAASAPAGAPDSSLTESAWQNPANPMDTNHDGLVSPLDALVGINLLSEISSPLLNANRKLPTSRPANSTLAYYDVNKDGFLSPLDVLIVVNYLNSPLRAQGELAIGTLPSSYLTSDTLKSTIVAPPRASEATLATFSSNDNFFRMVGETKRSVRGRTQPRPAKESNFNELLDALAADVAPRWQQ